MLSVDAQGGERLGSPRVTGGRRGQRREGTRALMPSMEARTGAWGGGTGAMSGRAGRRGRAGAADGTGRDGHGPGDASARVGPGREAGAVSPGPQRVRGLFLGALR